MLFGDSSEGVELEHGELTVWDGDLFPSSIVLDHWQAQKLVNALREQFPNVL